MVIYLVDTLDKFICAKDMVNEKDYPPKVSQNTAY